jgi:PAS domain S-box-containing protein
MISHAELVRGTTRTDVALSYAPETKNNAMALATRLTVAMIGLVLLTAVALALLAFRDAKPPVQLAGLVVVAVTIALAHLLAKPLARSAEDAAALDSDWRRIEAAEEAAKEKFRLVVEACPSGMVMVDPSGRIAMVNAEVERLFGYGRDQLMGQSVDMLMPERLRGHHARIRDGFMRKQETRRLGLRRDLFGQHKDGTEFPVEVGLNPIHLGNDLFILGVIIDISERKRIERLKDEFVSIVSHELRTPLTSIAGSLGLLAGGAAGKLPDPVTRLLTIARANSQRLVRLINDILDIEKMEAGQIVFQFSRVDARSLVEQALESNRGFADEYRVRLRLDADSVAGVVHADADRLSQVITNLLSNAIKFSPKDAEVVAAVEQRGDNIRISVRDHGCGIPAQFKPRVFEKFAQAEVGDTRQKVGSGLGLSIVKQIVTRLGGTAGFEDASGGGTVFHVDLPACEQASGGEFDVNGTDRLAQVLGPAIANNRQAFPKILHVDDDHDALNAVAEALRAIAQVVSVDTVEDARRAIAENHFDMVVLDIMVGAVSGLDLLPDLRTRKGSNIQVIIFSARGAEMEQRSEIHASLSKSRASLDRLVAAVQDHLMLGSARTPPEAA